MLKVAVLGAAGRMGRAVLSCIFEGDDLTLVGAVTETGDALLGRDAGELVGAAAIGVPLTDERSQGLNRRAGGRRLHAADGHGGQPARVRRARRGARHRHHGSRGAASARDGEGGARDPDRLCPQHERGRQRIHGARRRAPPRRSATATTLRSRRRTTGTRSTRPSGTALALASAWPPRRGRKLSDLAVYARQGQTGPRVPGTIGFAVIRGGNVVGEHAVRFIGAEEEVEFSHRAADRKTFARGALRAARWAAGQAPGLYSMADVLGLSRD